MIQPPTSGLDRSRPRVDEPRARAARPGDGRERLSLVEVAKTAAEDVLDLLSSQIKLARVELAADVHSAAVRAVRLVLFVPVLLGGYVFGMAALASALSGIWGWTLALALVSLLQIVLGGVGTAVSMKRLNAGKALDRAGVDAADNLKRTFAAVSSPGGRSRV